MKMSVTGMLVEVDKISFKVGAYVNATFQLDDGEAVNERMRSIKHYDKFYRSHPKKKGENEPPPKRLVELHFHLPSERTRTLITKAQLRQRTEDKKKKK